MCITVYTCVCMYAHIFICIYTKISYFLPCENLEKYVKKSGSVSQRCNKSRPYFDVARAIK